MVSSEKMFVNNLFHKKYHFDTVYLVKTFHLQYKNEAYLNLALF